MTPGSAKKGLRSAGVQRQYTGTSAKKENFPIGTLAYIAPTGHALIDRGLYLPESWMGDLDRRADAGIPDDLDFQTKPRMAIDMLQRALDAGMPFAWFTADEAFGQAEYFGVGWKSTTSPMSWRPAATTT